MLDLRNAVRHSADVCIIGGGMSGLIAAIAAARHGSRVLLMHDRPVLGGNASSEIRMWIRGAAGAENRETGILQEIELENIYRNPTMNYSLWDSVLLQFVMQEENITLLLNCSCLACDMDGQKIKSVTGWQLNTYTFHTVEAKVFMDCSGDSVLAPLTGAEYRVGREARAEYGEYAAPEVADHKTMGNSCLLQARETDHPCPFIAPEWANKYPDDASMHDKDHNLRSTNFWWIELGGEQDTLKDTQELGIELLKVALGVWDHIKNQGDHGAENWELEWVGFLPGKRETRRYVGDYVLIQQDLEEGHAFDDTVAYGGWTMDNHMPEGFRYPGYSSHHIQVKVPYAIPYRSLYSKNIENLMFAGRNISASHMAMSSTRVMATCSVIGQAAGTAAALAIKHGCTVREVGQKHICTLQNQLLTDNCFLPDFLRQVDRDAAVLSLPEEQAAVLQNGWERPHGENENRILLPAGSDLTLTLKAPAQDKKLRVVLDTDFSRESIAMHKKYKTFAMRAHIYADTPPLKLPANLLKSCEIVCKMQDGSETRFGICDNHQAHLVLPLPNGTVSVTLAGMTAWAEGDIGLYACDII